MKKVALLSALMAALFVARAANAQPVTNEHLLNAARDPQSWVLYGKDYTNQRYVELNQITTSNVARLAPKWVFQTRLPGDFEATPVLWKGIFYITSADNAVAAIDAKTGSQIWVYSRANPPFIPSCCPKVNRGVAILGNRLFMATVDAHVVALDAKTGALLWDTEMVDYRKGYTATVAPLVVGNKVIVGISGGDMGTRGFIDAYDVATGKRVWRFWSIPKPGEPGSETWTGDHSEEGGGPAWVTGSYDAETKLLYWNTGNPGPDFHGGARPGDNLYTNCLVALDPETGKMKWYYQYTPHDVWDYDGVNEVVLVNAEIAGKARKLLVHADRNGFFYAIDRTNGKFVYAKPYVKTTWAKEFTPEGRPIFLPGGEPSVAGNVVCPAAARTWQPMAYHPKFHLAITPAWEFCATFFGEEEPPKRVQDQQYEGSGPDIFQGGEGMAGLRAIDVSTGQKRWEYMWPASAPFNLHKPSGALTTSGGLVFFGSDYGYLMALDAATGKLLWKFNCGGAVIAPPITYLLDGKQYVAVIAGESFFTFALPDR